jgi:hypothetical protein
MIAGKAAGIFDDLADVAYEHAIPAGERQSNQEVHRLAIGAVVLGHGHDTPALPPIGTGRSGAAEVGPDVSMTAPKGSEPGIYTAGFSIRRKR